MPVLDFLSKCSMESSLPSELCPRARLGLEGGSAAGLPRRRGADADSEGAGERRGERSRSEEDEAAFDHCREAGRRRPEEAARLPRRPRVPPVEGHVPRREPEVVGRRRQELLALDGASMLAHNGHQAALVRMDPQRASGA
eukprot:14099364-Heterocapsa_arctica.AAC.2